MIHLVPTWPAVLAFLAAGVNNALGKPAMKADYVRWGFPAWWCYVTAALEVLAAALIALPATAVAGLILAALILTAAALAVLRRREFPHLVPLGVFAVLLVIAAVPQLRR